ncbi:hypothetical protein [Oryzibacter oryziterrae]|uniref:hypothetical protein n=1 Tax=Oryzibacter oryziterrae TaxID=2766474 RepID=UPI001F4369D0|nr:hypothetical protein [Oryzibacter oryziterrae]
MKSLIPALVLLASTVAAGATPRAYVETFDGPARPYFLTDPLRTNPTSAWKITQDKGAATFENQTDPSALTYVTIALAPYGGAGLYEATNGADIEVVVASDETAKGAAGVVVNLKPTPSDNHYVFFGIGPGGTFKCLEKVGGKLSALKQDTHPAIKRSGPNTLSTVHDGDAISFKVNGTVVYTMHPASTTKPNLVGLAAFGQGRYSFDQLTVREDEHGPRFGGSIPIFAPSSPATSKAPQPSLCTLKPMDEGHQLAVYTAVSPARLSTVGFDSGIQPTGLVDLEVEAGATPLSLVLTQVGSVIWRLGGATERIGRVDVIGRMDVPFSDGQNVGVIGVPADKVNFVLADDCPRFDVQRDQFHLLREAGKLGALLKTKPVTPQAIDKLMFGRRIPSGEVLPLVPVAALPPPGLDALAWTNALLRYPGGYEAVPVAGIVSPKTPIASDLLPSEFGMAQLIGEGKAELVDSGSTLHILAPIARLPVIIGPERYRMILAPDVPAPEGIPKEACVLRDGSGEVIQNAMACNN